MKASGHLTAAQIYTQVYGTASRPDHRRLKRRSSTFAPPALHSLLPRLQDLRTAAKKML